MVSIQQVINERNDFDVDGEDIEDSAGRQYSALLLQIGQRGTVDELVTPPELQLQLLSPIQREGKKRDPS